MYIAEDEWTDDRQHNHEEWKKTTVLKIILGIIVAGFFLRYAVHPYMSTHPQSESKTLMHSSPKRLPIFHGKKKDICPAGSRVQDKHNKYLEEKIKEKDEIIQRLATSKRMSICDGSPSVPTQPEDLFGDGRWIAIHKRFVTDAQEREPEVVFLGDSVIAYLGYTELWDRLFVPLHACNFGIGGERVENLLWRVTNGEIDQMKPKAIVIHIGTNNHGCTAEQIAGGIMTVVQVCRERQPQSEVVVLGLLPRGEHPNHIRDRNVAVNDILSASKQTKTHFLRVDPGIVGVDGTISSFDLWDYLHPSKECYAKIFEPVHEFLVQLFAEQEGAHP